MFPHMYVEYDVYMVNGDSFSMGKPLLELYQVDVSYHISTPE